MKQTLLKKCRFCKYYGQDHGTQGVCTLMNVPVHGEWQACRMGVLVFTCEERLDIAEQKNLSAPAAYAFAPSFPVETHTLQDEMWLTGTTNRSRQNTQEALA